ncbi:hypothetical protein HanIR_Chr02g0057141 [Helianthus annuus]|nr:hypothetical protein HanIR_Chr02g0057141 [Helianthus annuus]
MRNMHSHSQFCNPNSQNMKPPLTLPHSTIYFSNRHIPFPIAKIKNTHRP